MISKDKAIKRAKDFLNNYIGTEIIENDEDFFKNYPNDYLFENSDKPYYVWTSGKYHGCYNSQSYFLSEEEANQLIDDQLNGNHRENWDTIIFFDIENNKVVTPTLK